LKLLQILPNCQLDLVLNDRVRLLQQETGVQGGHNLGTLALGKTVAMEMPPQAEKGGLRFEDNSACHLAQGAYQLGLQDFKLLVQPQGTVLFCRVLCVTRTFYGIGYIDSTLIQLNGRHHPPK
jgi:hypothetical protein